MLGRPSDDTGMRLDETRPVKRGFHVGIKAWVWGCSVQECACKLRAEPLRLTQPVLWVLCMFMFLRV